MSSLRASPQGLKVVQQALDRLGWTKAATAWCQVAYTTPATLRRFWRRVPIKKESFLQICQAVGVNWKEIAEQEEITARRQDWGEAPDVSVFYGRTEELTALEQSIVKDRCRLLVLWGMGGIGKTALSVRIAKQYQDEFEYVIWRKLCHASPVKELLADLIEFISGDQEINQPATSHDQVLKLIDFLRQGRCLLVLDGWETVLQSGETVGSYREGFEGYGELLKQVGELSHRSCLMLTSREKPKEIAALEGNNRPCRSWQLHGLGEAAQEIFQEKDLSDREDWKELINSYRGNPLALKIVSTTIQDVFGGRVSEFLNKTLFLGDFEYLLSEQFARLSELEKKIMYDIAVAQVPVLCSELPENRLSEVSAAKLLTALESLARRSLIEKIKEGNETLFMLQPMVLKYVMRKYAQANLT